MTLLELRKRAYRRIGQPDFPDSEVSDRITGFMNYWHRRILAQPTAKKLRQMTLTIASVADTFLYAAPQAFNKIRYISERTNDQRLLERSEEWYRRVYADPTTGTGTPQYWVPMGIGRVATQPSAAAEIFIKSTSASDTGTAYLEAIRTGGYRRSLSVTMTGATAVSFAAAITDITAITDVFISAAAVGTVTVHQTSGSGTELARIPIGSTHPRYLLFALAPTPSSAITYYLDGIVDVVDMSADGDEPLFPLDFHDLLVDAAVYEEKRIMPGKQMDEVIALRADLELRIRDLKSWLWTNPEGVDPEARSLASQFDTVTSI